jgi:hypothetical protein
MHPSKGRITCLAPVLAIFLTPILTIRAHAQITDIEIDDNYHAQVTNFFCASASIEMALDTPAVTSANPVVTQLIGAGDGPLYPANTGYPTAGIEVQNGVGTVTAGSAQAFIYGLNHGLNTVNGVGYYNPYVPPGVGSDSQGVDFDLNALDNPNVNGAFNPAYPFGSHQYAGYNLANQGLANRTIANAIAQYNVPAVAVVNSGGHAISVYGVNTTGNLAPNQNYVINGVYVHDPWTGWAVAEQNAGKFNPALVNSNGGLGLGYNTYLRYGYDNDPTNGPYTLLPNGNYADVTLAPWTKIFNVSPPQLSPNAKYIAYGYKFEVEPQGPELPDTGDPAGDYGLPAAPANLPNAITSASTADSDGLSDLASDPTLQSDLELPGGSFDIADASEFQAPGESGSEGDWLVPYDGSGGINDVTGAIMIDADTGVIDEATWIDPTNSEEIPYTLNQIDTLYQDEEAGDLPVDDPPVPEPASAALVLGACAIGLIRRRGTN